METMIKGIHSGKALVWVLLQLPQPLHRAIRRAAAEDELTMRSMVNVALRDYAERRGLLVSEGAEDGAPQA